MTCTVVVCTRNRPEELDRCLAALARLDYPHYDVLVVDSAPDDRRAEGVARRWSVRYVVAPIAGVSRARNTGARASTGDIVAFTDDDAVAEPAWLSHLAAGFRDPEVGAVTGRLLTLDEEAAGGRGELDDLGPVPVRLDRTHANWFERASFGGIGNGGNMAFRRRLFEDWKGFDERLGRGGLVPEGEEHQAFAALLARGYAIVYAPDAIVRHPAPGARRGWVRSRATLARYALFLFLTTPNKRRVVRYAIEGALGVRRPWRSRRAPAAGTPRGPSAFIEPAGSGPPPAASSTTRRCQ